jgi:hypothetical protein
MLSVMGPVSAATVTDYKPVRLSSADQNSHSLVAIRRFLLNNVAHLLLVDPATLKTRIAKESSVTLSPDLPTSLVDSPYLRAVARYTATPWPLQNDGAIHADQPVDGVFLSVDLCPSKRPFERQMFESLPPSSRGGKPVPVAVAITGNWLTNHPAEFAWLKNEVSSGNLEITWVNHSLTHPYDQSASLGRTFLLTPGTDFGHEILETERLLIERDEVPSVFFRFPGLVSDRQLMKRLAQFSLIPLGSDAWLAKGELPRNGSFILIHGNGNEPAGITRFIALLNAQKGMRFLPIQKAFLP